MSEQQPVALPLEDEFRVCQYAARVAHMTDGEQRTELVRLYQFMLQRQEQFKRQLAAQWGI